MYISNVIYIVSFVIFNIPACAHIYTYAAYISNFSTIYICRIFRTIYVCFCRVYTAADVPPNRGDNALFRAADVLVGQWIGECSKLRVHYSKPAPKLLIGQFGGTSGRSP